MRYLPWAMVLVAVAVAVFVYLRGPERVVETRVEYRDREVVKYVDREVVRVEKRDVVRYVKVTKPDGTVTETHEADRGTTNTAATERVVEKVVEKIVTKHVTETRSPSWLVSAGVRAPLRFPLAPVYDLSVSRRILGPVFLGIQGDTALSFGLRLTVEF